MAPRVHPCICGFISRTYPQMKRHRRVCVPWLNRSDPKAIRSARQRKTREIDAAEGRPRIGRICPVCSQRSDHHKSSCSFSAAARMRRALIKRVGIRQSWWERFLRVLQKWYEAKKLNPLGESAGTDPARTAGEGTGT